MGIVATIQHRPAVNGCWFSFDRTEEKAFQLRLF
jgi:hypothetical protein